MWLPPTVPGWLRLPIVRHRPGTSLRTTLLSLGSALTLLVACTLVVAALLRALNTTIPEQAPALVLYDVLDNQAAAVENIVRQVTPAARIDLVPLVRSRILAVNERPLLDRPDTTQARMRDATRRDYKLSYRANNIDDVRLVALRAIPQVQQGAFRCSELAGQRHVRFSPQGKCNNLPVFGVVFH